MAATSSSFENRGYAIAEFVDAARTLGKRLGEMHDVLARPSDDEAFSPTPADRSDCKNWATQTRAQIDAALAVLADARAWPDHDSEQLATALLKARGKRSEEHTSELQSLMRISYAVFCLKKKKRNTHEHEL